MRNYENSLGPRPEGNSESEKGYLITADALKDAGLLCAACRGDLVCYIEEGRIIVEPSEDEDEELDEDNEMWSILSMYLPVELLLKLEDAGCPPMDIWLILAKKGWFDEE